MKVIDILTEGVAGEVPERVLKSILGHATWSAAQKIAFKDSVDLCADAIEQLLLKGQDLKSPAATKAAWFAIQPRLQGTPWATKEFVQEVFTVAKAEAEDRVAKKAGTFKPKEEPTATAKPKADDVVEKAAFDTTKKVMGTGLALLVAGDIGNDVYEYCKNQDEFMRRVKSGQMTAEQAKEADVQQKVILVQKIALMLAVPTIVGGLNKLLVSYGPTIYKWMPDLFWGVTPKLWAVIKQRWAVKRPPGMTDAEYAKLVELASVKWENLSSTARNSILAMWVTALNSNERIAKTANWKIYNKDGSETGYTVGTAPGGHPEGLTPKEMIAWFAINYSVGHDFSPWIVEAFEQLFTGTTQQQDIAAAAPGAKPQAKPANTVPKKEKVGNTTWQGDWEN